MLFKYKVRIIDNQTNIVEYYYFDRKQAEIRLDEESLKDNSRNICELIKLGINGIKVIV